MPSINFKERFVAAIERGEKCQTIRKNRKRPFRPGDTLYLFSGMRTARCKRLGTKTCVKVQPIHIDRQTVCIDEQTLNANEILQLALADGFDSTEAFTAFFAEQHSLPFEGQIIYWAPADG